MRSSAASSRSNRRSAQPVVVYNDIAQLRSHGIYTKPGPHHTLAPRSFVPLLALLTLVIAVAGLAAIVVRRNPAPPQVQTPALVSSLPNTKALCARNRIFADEVLGAQQLSLADRGALSVKAAIQPVTYNLPKTIPTSWLTNRRYADEALAELRMPAPQAASPPSERARPAMAVVIPNIKTICAYNRIFADDVLSGMSYNFGASAAAFSWPTEIVPRTGPR